MVGGRGTGKTIIPYQELPGNYNFFQQLCNRLIDYTIPRTTRELQLLSGVVIFYL